MSSNPVDLNAFRKDPPHYLGARALEIISIPANLTDSKTRTVTVNFQNDPDSLKWVQYPMDVVTLSLKNTHRSLYMSVGVDGKMKMMKDPTHSSDAVLDAYYLPWGPSVAYSVQLGKDRKFFATAKVDGCCIIVSGDRTAPTVMHINYAPDESRVVPETQAILDHRQAAFHYDRLSKEKHNEYTRFYGGFAADLIKENIIDGFKPIGVYDPAFYLSKGGWGTVFGVWRDDHDYKGWKFYYNINNGNRWITSELWPAIVGSMPTAGRS